MDKMDLSSRPELFDFHGVSMTHYFTDNWENMQNFQARPDDIFITSYPKTGNTWLSYLLDLLYFGQTSPERQTSIPIYARIPILEIAFPSPQPGSGPSPPILKGTEMADKLPTSPRVIKTHLPVHFVPKSIWEENCKMELPPRPTLFDFHGVSMTKYFTDNWDNIQNFKARADDILIATYPKAGTTWVSYILDLLYFGQTCPEHQESIPLYERVPFLEISIPGRHTGKDLADQLPTTPRLIKTHLPVQFIPKSFWEQNSRIVYVARNAKDCAVSYFHFDRMNNVQPEPGDWSTFLQNFVEGKMVFGSWYDHVNNWWEKKQTYSKLHYMFYEDLIEDSGREIDRLCSFLGLSPSAEKKERVMAQVTFDNMKENKMANYSNVQMMNHKVSPFMRKGKVGDWKNHFTVAQNEQFDEDYKQKMKNPTLQFRTKV